MRESNSLVMHEYKVYARLIKKCVECGRRFDLTNELDAAEWHHGHDCEA
jgi:hypothetical protein